MEPGNGAGSHQCCDVMNWTARVLGGSLRTPVRARQIRVKWDGGDCGKPENIDT